MRRTVRLITDALQSHGVGHSEKLENPVPLSRLLWAPHKAPSPLCGSSRVCNGVGDAGTPCVGTSQFRRRSSDGIHSTRPFERGVVGVDRDFGVDCDVLRAPPHCCGRHGRFSQGPASVRACPSRGRPPKHLASCSSATCRSSPRQRPKSPSPLASSCWTSYRSRSSTPARTRLSVVMPS